MRFWASVLFMDLQYLLYMGPGLLETALSVSPSFDPSRRNWFRIFRLVTIIAIGLRTPMLSQKQVQVLYFMMFIDLLEGW
jgi:hypothetical protein